MPKPLIQTTGRRKESVARVRLRAGTGKVVINGRPVEQYFTILTHVQRATEALRLTQTADVYDVEATITADCDLGMCTLGRTTIFAFDKHRRPEAYTRITGQVGATAPRVWQKPSP